MYGSICNYLMPVHLFAVLLEVTVVMVFETLSKESLLGICCFCVFLFHFNYFLNYVNGVKLRKLILAINIG